jgi:type II secretory pathway component GspD/PulD (secretin)
LNTNTNQIHLRNCTRLLLSVALVLTGITQSARAQEAEEQKSAPTKPAPQQESTVTVYLKYVGSQQEANDLQTAVRNMVTHARVYYDQSANALTMRGPADELAMAQKVIADLDRPKKAYRLEYTVQMMDGAKPGATQHYALIVVPGERAQLKLGNRVPLVTGKTDGDTAPASSQVQYIDVGLSISATLSGGADGLMLRSKVEQTTLADEKSGMGPQDPVLHQAVLENASTIALGKPLILGSLDIPGATNKLVVEVVADPVK